MATKEELLRKRIEDFASGGSVGRALKPGGVQLKVPGAINPGPGIVEQFTGIPLTKPEVPTGPRLASVDGVPPVPTGASEPFAGPIRPAGVRMEGPAGREGVLKELIPGGVRYDAGTKGFAEGQGAGGGGGFMVTGDYRGPTSTSGMTDDQFAAFENQRQADIASNVAGFESQTAAIRDLRNVRRSAAGLPPVGQRREDMEQETTGPSWRVGTPEYTRMRNATLTARNTAEEANRNQRRALARLPKRGRSQYRPMEPQMMPMTDSTGSAGPAMPSIQDQLGIGNQALKVAEFQRDSAVEQEKAARANQRLAMDTEAADYGRQNKQFELSQQFAQNAANWVPQGFPGGSISMLAELAMSEANGDPNKARQIMMLRAADMVKDGPIDDEQAMKYLQGQMQ